MCIHLKKSSNNHLDTVRCCSISEAIKLTDAINNDLGTGKLNRKNWTVQCENVKLKDVLKSLNTAAKNLNIDIPINERVYAAEFKDGVFLKF